MESTNWSTEETRLLISLYGAAETQKKLGGLYRNKNVYQEISRKMVENGFSKTIPQCRGKVKNLTARYRKALDINRKSGRARKTSPFYDELNAILGDRPSYRPRVVLDSASRGDEDRSDSEDSSAHDRSEDTIEDPSDTEGSERRPEPVLDADGLRPVTPPPTETATVENSTSGESSSNTDADRDRTPAPKETRPKPTTRNGKRKKSKFDTSLEAFASVFAGASSTEDKKLHLELQAQQHAHEMAMLRQILGVFSKQRQQGTPPPAPPMYQQQQQQWQPQGGWGTPPPSSQGQQQWQDQPYQSFQGALNGASPTATEGQSDRVVQHGELLFFDM
ncbi:myb/SANT-like DNA-binding domain-containing protein 7 [Branchiostoma lanceolatum]|uniref:myb/SANT-like DNA-binding domain-containing protein 7 n=1 Tax=Branchiostoma lanceolatum TaxID=7740 RepID=UPI0034511413